MFSAFFAVGTVVAISMNEYTFGGSLSGILSHLLQ